jgi:predicted kinase
MFKANEINEADPVQYRVILMHGLPYSGKSTEARRLSKKYGWPIVNPDAVRVALHGSRFLAVMEPWVWLITFLMVKVMHLTGYDTVIVDACNNTRKRRDEWRRVSPEDVEILLVPVWTSSSECIERAAKNNDQEIIPQIGRMAQEYELPGLDEVYFKEDEEDKRR